MSIIWARSISDDESLRSPNAPREVWPCRCSPNKSGSTLPAGVGQVTRRTLPASRAGCSATYLTLAPHRLATLSTLGTVGHANLQLATPTRPIGAGG